MNWLLSADAFERGTFNSYKVMGVKLTPKYVFVLSDTNDNVQALFVLLCSFPGLSITAGVLCLGGGLSPRSASLCSYIFLSDHGVYVCLFFNT